MKLRIILFSIAMIFFSACVQAPASVLKLGTTTSTYDSGLLDAILPAFEAQENVVVDVIAVGTGQALALGEAGDVDIILVHARTREEAFLAEGHGTERYDVMYNDFILVGPATDPVQAQRFEFAVDALAEIANAEAPFASRGDDSGTHIKELGLWTDASVLVRGEWYASLGQGMAETLLFAQQTGAYTLTDRGTFLSLQDDLPGLAVIVGGDTIAENVDPALLNPYSIIPVNPDKGGIEYDLAMKFVVWLTSLEVQAAIAEFGMDIHNQPLFYPDSAAWNR